MSPYDRMLQEESQDWFEGYDEETTDGYLEELEAESKSEIDRKQK